MAAYTVLVDLSVSVDAETEDDAQEAAENLVIDHLRSIDRKEIDRVHLDRSQVREVTE